MINKFVPIKNFENEYLINTNGDIYSLYRNKIIKPTLTKGGYLHVGLNKNKIAKYFYVHRLVGETFIENVFNYPEINHKNEIKTDNRVENLEWCTPKYNSNYGTKIERCSKRVSQYNKDGTFIKTWNSTLDAQRNGFHSGDISRCCNGIRKSAKGYIWKYET